MRQYTREPYSVPSSYKLGYILPWFTLHQTMEASNICASICMVGGKGPHSYARNSSYQRAAADCSKDMIDEGIASNLDTKFFLSITSFRIADLGCSIGPNTFIAVQNIIEAVENMYQSQGQNLSSLEFQVFFNDHASNDFNTLFSSLPPERDYFAMGVPGSFHGRLFPKNSLHFVYSCYTLHWLSQMPKGLEDIHSPAWNKGKIHYTNAPNDVFEAYSAQFSKDMRSFLKARAEEVVPEGLLALVIPAVPNGDRPSESFICLLQDLLGCALMDMASMGLVTVDKVHSFNLPMYYSSPQEIEEIIQSTGYFTIERMITTSNPMKDTLTSPQTCSRHVRAGVEELIKEHFGSDIVEELFYRYTQKIAEASSCLLSTMNRFIDQFVLLKRKVSSL